MASSQQPCPMAAACGADCGECAQLQDGTCSGCAHPGRAGWHDDCAVFACCVVERGLEHCGLCLDFPCQLFLGHASPLVVARRYRALTLRAEMRTEAWAAHSNSARRTD